MGKSFIKFMCKMYDLLKIPEYRNDLTEREKNNRSCKILMLFILTLSAFCFAQVPVCAAECKLIETNEWICSCGYDNYDDIMYCPLCGGKKKPRR